MARPALIFSILLALAALLWTAAPAQAQRFGRGGFGGRGRIGGGFRGYRGYGYDYPYYGYGRYGYGGLSAYSQAGLGIGYGTVYRYGRGIYGNTLWGYGYPPDGGYYDEYWPVPPVVPEDSDDDLPVPRSAEPKAPTDNTARIRVILPPDAQLWFEGKLTTKRGEERDFYSPKLVPGKTYLYKIRARWRLGRRMVEQSGEFKVRANETTTVRFPLPVE
jgi:uncharacterized protein (TIGR03000 family)